MIEKDDVLGHRKRLREKFLKSGIAGFQDYEVIELLLSLGTPPSRLQTSSQRGYSTFQILAWGIRSV
jgi:DNA repair protein RadC